MEEKNMIKIYCTKELIKNLPEKEFTIRKANSPLLGPSSFGGPRPALPSLPVSP